MPHFSAIVIPDYMGQETREPTLSSAISELLPHAIVIRAVNGCSRIPAISPPTPPNCLSVLSPPGFNQAILAGLEVALATGATRIAKIDTNSHDPANLPALFAQLDHHDLAVLDHSFDPKTLAYDSAEYYHTAHVIPAVTSDATAAKLSLSGSHGLMAMRAPTLARLLPVARSLVTALITAGESPSWSLDTAIIIAASRLDLRIDHRFVRAHERRDNHLDKSALQLHDLLGLIRALDVIIPLPSPR